MSRFLLEIRVTPRPGLLDPQGKAIHHALHSLGWPQVEEVRVGKVLYLDLEVPSEDEAREAADAMCRKILANPVTEDFSVAVVREEEGARA